MKSYNYKSPSGISNLLMALLAFGGLLDIAAIFSGYSEYSLLLSIQQGEEITADVADANDLRQATIGSAQVILYLITVIFFCVWTYRMSSNAHSANDNSLKIKPGWAVGYYFIPILTLWRPYQALKEVYQSFRRSIGENEGSSIIALWWFTWIASNLLGRILLKSTFAAEELHELIQASLITMGTDAFNVLLDAAALAVVFVVTKSCVEFKKMGDAQETFQTIETDPVT